MSHSNSNHPRPSTNSVWCSRSIRKRKKKADRQVRAAGDVETCLRTRSHGPALSRGSCTLI
ncbi:hypothetical protein PAHAL_5G066600 [Panicum hallii]|uniref:Uncharacterized protein n=1 Tax=Panicum hallii TaxID=206008 RepID=A0A2T8IJB2_9POAL|nr:hypothetical protein PAHAL_5G066600 [Panicum hallii]